MTLLLLALASSAMTGLCLRSLRKANDAIQAQEELQSYWAMTSCRSTLLPAVEDVLKQAEKDRKQSLSAWRATIELGGQRIELIFGDEQAKSNLNTIWQRRGRRAVENAARRLIGTSQIRLQLLPRETKDPKANVFESLGQVFGSTPVSDWLAHDSRSPSAVVQISCWGDGTLNWRRATPQAIEQVCTPAITAAQSQRLISLLRKSPKSTIGILLDELELSIEHRQQVNGWLTDSSRCHSLWIIAASKSRCRYEFAVNDQSDSQEAKTYSFAW